MSVTKKIKEKLQESSLSRIHQATEMYATGAISGFRGELTRAQNVARNRHIHKELLIKGFGVTPVKGSYIENYNSPDAREVQEESFFVANIKVEGDDKGELERELIKLGQWSDQDSIMSHRFGGPAQLIGTSRRENTWPNFGERVPIGSFKGGKAGEFFSRIHNRPFTFD